MTSHPRPGTGEQPPALGALGQELARVVSPLSTAVLLLAAVGGAGVVALGLAPLVLEVGARAGSLPAILLFAIGAAIVLTLATAAVAFLPPLLLRGDDRAAIAVHSWIGAREARRAFGRPSRLVARLGTPEAAERFLAASPRDVAIRPVRFEALLFLRRFDEARAAADHLPERTPLEAYRKLEAFALVDEQTGTPLAEERLREEISRIPPGLDRTEAAASLAVALARRALPSGGWRRPLIEVRGSIDESDFRLLTRDFGLTTFELLARRVLLSLLVLLVLLAVALSAATLLVG